MIGNAGQPNACYIPARATSPLVGPGSLSPQRPQVKKDVGVIRFSNIPRFSSVSPAKDRPPTAPSHSFSSDSAGRPVHFSRRRSQTGSRGSVRSPSPSRQRSKTSPAKRHPPRYHPASISSSTAHLALQKKSSIDHTVILDNGTKLQYSGGVSLNDTSSTHSSSPSYA